MNINNLLSCKISNNISNIRNTTNNLCITHQKNNIFSSTKTIQVGNIIYRIPCFIVPYIPELKGLLQTMKMQDAIKLLASKYGIMLTPPIKNVRRYVYPTSIYKVIPPVTQFSITFKLAEKAIVTVPLPIHPKFIQMKEDARYISICNNDTNTFSNTIPDMINNNSYWFYTLPIFKTHYLYAAINHTDRLLTAHTGYIILQDNRLIFLPTILNEFIFLYQTYAEQSAFIFLYIGEDFMKPNDVIKKLYFSSPLSCYFKTYKG